MAYGDFKNPELAGLNSNLNYNLGNYTGLAENFGNSLGSNGRSYNYSGSSMADRRGNTIRDGASSGLGGIGSDTTGGGFLDNLSGWGDLAAGLGGLASSFAAYKQLGLAEDTFKFNKDMKTKEYAMAKDAYDKNVKRAASVGEQMRAGKVG